MRVLSGSARGVPLKTVPDMLTRPILDRIKKSLFSMLDAAGLMLDARVADFYAGAGTQGIEALSRGAEYCLFVEKRAEAAKLLKENLDKTRLAEKAEVRVSEVAPVLRSLVQKIEQAAPGGPLQHFDLILYDPPFSFSRESATRAAAEEELALAGKLLFPGHARLILRFEKDVETPAPEGLDVKRYWTDGPHAFAFYARKTD